MPLYENVEEMSCCFEGVHSLSKQVRLSLNNYNS